MKKRDLLELLSVIKDDEDVQFESMIEGGYGYVGDFDCDVDLFFNQDDKNWRLRFNGDKYSDSGIYD